MEALDHLWSELQQAGTFIDGLPTLQHIQRFFSLLARRSARKIMEKAKSSANSYLDKKGTLDEKVNRIIKGVKPSLQGSPMVLSAACHGFSPAL
jgi:hypothetical protein